MNGATFLMLMQSMQICRDMNKNQTETEQRIRSDAEEKQKPQIAIPKISQENIDLKASVNRLIRETYVKE